MNAAIAEIKLGIIFKFGEQMETNIHTFPCLDAPILVNTHRRSYVHKGTTLRDGIRMVTCCQLSGGNLGEKSP